MKPLVTDELWVVVEPLLPKRRLHRKGGRPWVDAFLHLGCALICWNFVAGW